MDYIGRLHFYPQRQWHDTAYVVGDRHALTALRAAIDVALAEGLGTALGNTTDNEDYRVVVLLSDPRGKRARGTAWSDLAPPYSGDEVRDIYADGLRRTYARLEQHTREGPSPHR